MCAAPVTNWMQCGIDAVEVPHLFNGTGYLDIRFFLGRFDLMWAG